MPILAGDKVANPPKIDANYVPGMIHGRFSCNHWTAWSIFHCHVWVPEGIIIESRSIYIYNYNNKNDNIW